MQSRGKAYQDLKLYEKSLEDFNLSIEIYPQDSMIYIYRGLSLIELKKYQKALQDFNTSIKLGCKSPDVFAGIS